MCFVCHLATTFAGGSKLLLGTTFADRQWQCGGGGDGCGGGGGGGCGSSSQVKNSSSRWIFGMGD